MINGNCNNRLPGPWIVEDAEMPPQSVKSKQHNDGCAIDYNYFLNEFGKRRKPSPLRELISLTSRMPEQKISLAVGCPNAERFPITEISITLNDGTSFTINGTAMQEALQYLPSSGYGPLLKFLKNWQDTFHCKQPWDERNILVTSGSQEGMKLAVDAFMTEGDSVVCQIPTYAGAVDLFKPFQAEFILAEQDEFGIIPEILNEKLSHRLKEGKPMPKLFYINPTGANPTGVTITTERKIKLYKLACTYNLLILEDDPYFFITFTQGYPQSFLSMDTEGRVLRFDSFSKILSPGMRVGYITGPKMLIRRIELNLQISSLHCSSLSQSIVYNVFQTWGHQKIMTQFENTKQFYLARRDFMLHAADEHLKDLAEWNVPMGGMFLWIRIKALDSIRNLIMKRCADRFLIVTPGYVFLDDEKKKSSYIRLSYGIESFENISKGLKLLATVIREEIMEQQNQTLNNV